MTYLIAYGEYVPKGQGQSRDQGCTLLSFRFILTRFIAGYSPYVPKEDKYVPKEEKYVPKEDKYVPKEEKYAPKEDKYIPKEEKYAPKEDKQKRDTYSSQSCKTNYFSRYP
jgi:hypothetical protein